MTADYSQRHREIYEQRVLEYRRLRDGILAGGGISYTGTMRYVEGAALAAAKIITFQAQRFDRTIRALDVGCAYGEMCECIDMFLCHEVGRQRPRFEYWGLDIMRDELAEAARLHRDLPCHFVCGDGVALPFREDAFDTTTCSGTLVYLNDPGSGLREIARVTRGVAFVGTWSVMALEPAVLTDIYGRAVTIPRLGDGLDSIRRDRPNARFALVVQEAAGASLADQLALASTPPQEVLDDTYYVRVAISKEPMNWTRVFGTEVTEL